VVPGQLQIESKIMITRIWHGTTSLENSDEYLEKMKTVALPDYRSTPGNKGAYVLHRIEDDIAHFNMLTFWEDIEAVKKFAGEDSETPKYYEFDKKMLLELEDFSRNYETYD
jgi:heme-degrading monooxygenase HmoA